MILKRLSNFFKKHRVCIDLYFSPIKAKSMEDGKTLDCTPEQFSNIIDADVKKSKDTGTIKENLADMIFSKTHEYQKETLNAIQRYIYDSFEIKGREVSLFVATPPASNFYNRQVPLVYKTFLRKTREIFFLSGFMAALSSDRELFEGFKENKVIFLHILETCTHSGIIFEGGEFHVSTLDKGFSTISIKEIGKEIKAVLERKDPDLPDSFKEHPDIPGEEIDRFRELWDDDSNYRLVLAVPGFMKKKIGKTLPGYTVHYLDNYDECVLSGLSGVAENIRGIERQSTR